MWIFEGIIVPKNIIFDARTIFFGIWLYLKHFWGLNMIHLFRLKFWQIFKLQKMKKIFSYKYFRKGDGKSKSRHLLFHYLNHTYTF